MQGKGIVKFFLVLLLLICAGQFIYYIPTNRVEKDADAYAQKVAATATGDKATVEKQARISYLDSMSSEKVFSIPLIGSYTYQDLKSKQLALGLDLKGGMSVLLQVDLKDFLRALSGNNTDPNFVKAIDEAKKVQAQSQGDFITIFADEYKKLAGEGKLAAVFARNESLKGSINIESSDAQVKSLIRQKANETVNETFERLKSRIDKLGVVQPNVSLDANRDIIVVELPGIDNPERARNFLQKAAKLEFWEVYRISDAQLGNALVDADNTLKAIQEGKPDSLASKDTSKALVAGPLFSVLSPNGGTLSPAVVGVTEKNKRDLVMNYLNQPEIAAKFPRDMVFTWSKDPIKDATGKSTGAYELYALKKSVGKDGPALDGERVTDARAQSADSKGGGGIEVSLQMDNTGAAQWAALTTQCARDNNREVAIVLDDEVVSAPRVINPIEGGRSSITGSYTVQEAQDLASILQVGKLPAKAEIIQENTIGPSLGAENIRSSMLAMAIAFLAIMAFMTIYYSTGGIISVIALLANLFFIIGMLTSKGTVLTLPGIAGIVLTMGMAVDANVIIYERIREELAEGKSMLQAIADGFKQSFSAILDGNVTTLITALILWYFGLGPIKGFGIVLAIGILFTLFTAVLLSRLIVDWWTGRGNEIKFFAPFSERAFKNINFDWMGFRFKAYAISGAVIIAGIISMFTRGFELGVDFKGGYSYNIQFDKAVDADQLREGLTKAFEGQSTIVKAVNTQNTFNVTTSYLINETSDVAQDKVTAKLFEGVNTLVGGNLNLEEFKKTDAVTTHITSQAKVGPAVADDIKRSALWSIILGILGIGGYILLRFNRWQYSLGGIVALFHDVMITLAFFSILHGFVPFSMEIDQAIIAALLTIVGYSINDTVIVYDRIREFMRKYTQKPMGNVINDAINSTLSRTIITSSTVLIVVVILFIFGGASIKGFSFAMLIGVVAGTYSSVFIAAPIMLDFSKNVDLSEYKPQTTEGGTNNKKSLKEKV